MGPSENTKRDRSRRVQTLAKRGVSPIRIAQCLLALIGCALSFAVPCSAQVTWLNPEDGDVLNLSTAHILNPGETTARVTRSTAKSEQFGTLLFHRFQLEYGLMSHISVGLSGRHMEQLYLDEFKKGLGDSNFFAKIRLPLFDRKSSLSFALRQSLTVPTGFEAERDELLPFTSRHNDYSAELLGSYRARRIAIHLSPGVVLPGGDAPTLLTFGSAIELDQVLPLDVDIAGEYYTRWDMVEERFESDVSVHAERALFGDVGVNVGVKRRLLKSQSVDPEIRIGFTYGHSRSRPAGPFPRQQPHALPIRLTIDPLVSETPDPYGLTELLNGAFATQGPRFEEQVSLFVQSPWTSPEEMDFGGGAYRLRMRVLSFTDGQVSAFTIPKILKVPRAESQLFLEATLYDRDGLPLCRPVVLESSASQGLGAQLAPMTTRTSQMVVPDEVRADLRRQLVALMAEDVLDQTTEIISLRVKQQRHKLEEEQALFLLQQDTAPPIPELVPQIEFKEDIVPEVENPFDVPATTIVGPEAELNSGNESGEAEGVGGTDDEPEDTGEAGE